jgi:hypothetical protein
VEREAEAEAEVAEAEAAEAAEVASGRERRTKESDRSLRKRVFTIVCIPDGSIFLLAPDGKVGIVYRYKHMQRVCAVKFAHHRADAHGAE